MGLLKRVFGKGDAETDKRIEKEIEQIESGEITKVYPILKPGDWVGIQAGAVRQTLFGTPEEPKLVLGFGYDTPSNFVFLMPRDIEGKDSAQVVGDAYANLEEAPSVFESIDALDGKVLASSGNDFSSEKILCKSHMDKAHELLGSDELLVSVPRRTCMYITSRSADEDTLDKFIGLHSYTWKDDSYGNAPIINALIVVKGGEISGIIPLED